MMERTEHHVGRIRSVNEKEKNELLFKLMLVLVRDRQAMRGRIRSVGYTREYGELPPDFGVYTLSRLQDDEIASLADRIGIRRTRPHGAKSDIYLNDIGYAIYNFAQDKPVILDGVTREALQTLCRLAGAPFETLDEHVKEFLIRHQNGQAGESIAVSDPDSPFSGAKQSLAPVLRYVMFEGSVSGPSMFPAECVLHYTDPLNTETWSIYEPDETIDEIWGKLVLNVREMPYDGTGAGWTLDGHPGTQAALTIRVEAP